MKVKPLPVLLLVLIFCGIFVFVYLRNVAPGAAVKTSLADSEPREPISSEETTVYLVCYFQDYDGNLSWYWGLTSNNAYFTFNGTYVTTDLNMTKLVSTAKYSDLCEACNRAQAYYKANGLMTAFLAGESNAGYSYPIVLGGNQLFPRF